MIRFALKDLLGRKFRAILTSLAIVLGVAMVSGTFVLTDTIQKAFDNLFKDSYANTSVVVGPKKVVDFASSGTAIVPEELLARIKALPGVDAAVGGITDYARLIDKEGKPISAGGAPTFGFSYDRSEPQFNPTRLTTGRWAAGPNEVVIDKGTADKKGFRVGEPIGVAGRGPVETFTISGIARFGTVDSIGGATFAIFDLTTAQRFFHKEGVFDGIQVAAKAGVDPAKLAAEIRTLLPRTLKSVTAAEQAASDSKDTNEGIAFVRYFLLAFGGIALFVGAFVIFNTLSITVAQRAREFATLRTLGASRRQVLRAVVVEAFLIGLAASLVGLFLGLLLAKGLNSVFVAVGIDLPTAGTVFASRTIAVSLFVGVVITVVAGLMPAVRATRVPPIAAVREGAVLPKTRLAPFAPWIALLAVLGALALLGYGMFGSGLSTVNRLIALGGGVLVLFTGVAIVSSRLVRPMARVLGRPAETIGGAAGTLARQNAMRNPGRTAATAAALMIGLALVTFVAVLGQGLRDSVVETIKRQVQAEYVITSTSGFEPIERGVGQAAARSPVIETVSSVRADQARVNGKTRNVTGIDPETIDRLYIFDWKKGSSAASLAALDRGGALVNDQYATESSLRVGSQLRITSPSGTELAATVSGVYKREALGSLLGEVSIAQRTFDSAFREGRDLYTFINVTGDPAPASAAALEKAIKGFPDAAVHTKDEYVADQQKGVDMLLNLLYVLLALSVIVSLFGMINTLVLSVFERTRELGMLRAVGMTRRQVRRMVRHESVITALIGAALGLPLGVFLAALVTQALKDEGVVFGLPVGNLVVFAVIAVFAGILSAVAPARRASRLNVLEALQYE